MQHSAFADKPVDYADENRRLGCDGCVRLLFAGFCHYAIILMTFMPTRATLAENSEVQWLPPAVLENRYDVALPVRGGEGSLKWTLQDELPSGLLFQHGRIAGVPELVGTWEFGIIVRDEIDGSLQTKFGISVLPAPAPELRIVSRALPAAHRGVAYSATLQAEGGYPPYMWNVSEDDLPAWASIEGHQIRGTPRSSETIRSNRFHVEVRDSRGNSTGPETLLLQVEENPLSRPLRISPARELPSAVAGIPYQAEIQAAGGVPPYRISIKTDCPGLEHKGDGVLSGTAVDGGMFYVHVSLRDADGESLEARIRIPVVDPDASEMTIGEIHSISTLQGETMSFSIPVAGGLKPYESRLLSDLPAGLEWNAESRTVSGVPAEAGEWHFRVSMSDSSEKAATVGFPIRVQARTVDARDREPITVQEKSPGKPWVYIAAAGGWILAGCLAYLLILVRRRGRGKTQ